MCILKKIKKIIGEIFFLTVSKKGIRTNYHLNYWLRLIPSELFFFSLGLDCPNSHSDQFDLGLLRVYLLPSPNYSPFQTNKLGLNDNVKAHILRSSFSSTNTFRLNDRVDKIMNWLYRKLLGGLIEGNHRDLSFDRPSLQKIFQMFATDWSSKSSFSKVEFHIPSQFMRKLTI